MTKEELLKELAKRASEGRLAFFIGAGFSKAVMGKYEAGPLKDKDRALSWIDLLLEVAKKFEVEDVVPNNKCKHPLDCPQIASAMIKSLHEKSNKSMKDCDALIKDYVCQLTNWYPNTVNKDKWSKVFEGIRPSVIITTNYDHVIEAILERDAVSFSTTESLPTTFDEKYLIYHMHGVRNRPDDIVLTREDYVEAMRPFSYRQVRLTTLLRENSILYLGYGRNDLNILSAMDVAQQTFPDLKGRGLASIHVQVDRDGFGDDEVEEMSSSSQSISLYVIKVKEIYEFLKELGEAREEYEKGIRKDYDFLERLKSLVSDKDSQGNPKGLAQRRSDIINAFENNAKVLNEPTKEGRRLSFAFDDFIKKHYRRLFGKAHRPGNWERYADMWSLLYAYFLVLSRHSSSQGEDKYNKPMPYTRRFGYAIGWFNGLAYFIGEENGKSHLAWEYFKEDWPCLSDTIRETIELAAKRCGYQNILNLLSRISTGTPSS